MTKISVIHGIPADEIKDRAKMLRPATFIPANRLSDGQMNLVLLRDNARILGDYSGQPVYKKAEALIDNALYYGIHGSLNFSGDLRDDVLQRTAAIIKQAKNKTRNAMGIDQFGFSASIGDDQKGRGGTNNAAGPGATNIPLLGDEADPYAAEKWAYLEVWKKHRAFFNAWKPAFKETDKNGWQGMTQKSVKWPNQDAKDKILAYFADRVAFFKDQNFVIKTYNQSIEKSGHHFLYHQIDRKWQGVPNRVDFKRVLHSGGISALAEAGLFQRENMSLWVENGILRKNIEGGVGAESSINSSFILAGASGEAYQSQYQAAIKGFTPDQIIKLVVAITAALGAIVTLVGAVRNKRPAPFASAQLIDTKEYSADESDWKQLTLDPLQPTPETTDNTTLYLAAGAAALLLLNGKK